MTWRKLTNTRVMSEEAIAAEIIPIATTSVITMVA